MMPEIDVYSCGELDSASAHFFNRNGTPSCQPIKLDWRVKI